MARIAHLLIPILMVGHTAAAEPNYPDFSMQIDLVGQGLAADPEQAFITARILPNIRYQTERGEWQLDSQLTGNFSGSWLEPKPLGGKNYQHLEKLHRLWVSANYDTSQITVGLQKINFGSARILRSLQWFDELDSQDPTQFTRGIKAALIKHYFADDSNIWAWFSSKNTEPLGTLPLRGSSDEPEFGGRFQQPIPSGELAISVHHRLLDDDAGLPTEETKLGLDGFFDVLAGLWFETSWSHFHDTSDLINNLFFTTVGGDYTFDIGDGLHALAEVQLVTIDSKVPNTEANHLTAVVVSTYTLSIIEQITALWTRGLTNETTHVNLSYQQTRDSVLWRVGYFYQFFDPAASALTRRSDVAQKANGHGVQLFGQINF